MFFRRADTLPLAGIAVGLLLSQTLGLPDVARAFFQVFGVLAAGYLVGPVLLPHAGVWLASCWGILTSVATLMLLRGAWFYAGGLLNNWGDAWTTIGMIALAIAGIVVWKKEDRTVKKEESTSTFHLLSSLFTFASLIGLFALLLVALQNGTTESIRTPWPLLPEWTLPLIGVLWAIVLVHAWRTNQSLHAFIQTACALGAITLLTPLLYRIGYGFDGFLHVAGETVLANSGTLTPAPPYYLGQYVLVTWIARLFELDITLVDRWLVPIAAMVLIPAAAWIGVRRKTAFAALVLIPFGPFIATTPHGFATVLAVVALLLSIAKWERFAVLPILFASWSALTHPLVGLPVLCAVVAALCWNGRWRWIGIPSALVAGISVPLVFGLAAGLGSSAGVEFDLTSFADPNAWGSTIALLVPWTANRFALWPQASVWVEKLLPWITILFAILAMRKRDDKPITSTWIISASSTFIAAIVLRVAGDFGFLIDYERGNYADRLFLVAWLLLLPAAIPELARLLERAKNGTRISRVAIVLSVALLGAGASYAALPRHDAVTPSRGWSVGAADLEAVKLMDQDAAGKPYTVLANQSVSAAAVKTFGFKRYNGDIFYYPIPTGGPLYEVFLYASYEEPSRDTMAEAAQLGGSDLVYFVVNDYWWRAPALAEQAASTTDREFVIQNGKVKVFKYISP